LANYLVVNKFLCSWKGWTQRLETQRNTMLQATGTSELGVRYIIWT